MSSTPFWQIYNDFHLQPSSLFARNFHWTGDLTLNCDKRRWATTWNQTATEMIFLELNQPPIDCACCFVVSSTFLILEQGKEEEINKESTSLVVSWYQSKPCNQGNHSAVKTTNLFLQSSIIICWQDLGTLCYQHFIEWFLHLSTVWHSALYISYCLFSSIWIPTLQTGLREFILKQNSYPANFLCNASSSPTQNTADTSSSDEGQEEEKEALVVIPYVAGMSEDIRHVCRKFIIRVVFQSGRTLHSCVDEGQE